MNIEETINALTTLAYNLWWTWNPEAQRIFEILSPYMWERTNHNPITVLKRISQDELRSRLYDPDFSSAVQSVLAEFAEYMQLKKNWCTEMAGKSVHHPVAYFSAEFGLHESLPIYSGGLGILAGDFAKSASDLGIPFVGISLFYRYGYFQQRIDPDGWQREEYATADPASLPLELVTNGGGAPVVCTVEIDHATVAFHAWRLNVGRTTIFLLDTNRPENEERFRDITGRVYGGDATTRISQEIVLGIGGVRFLRAIGIAPSIYHMNEGHSAFLTLELLRENLSAGSTIQKAAADVRKQTIFTTHTPVAAGHDSFTPSLVEYMFERFSKTIPMTKSQLLGYGRANPDDPNEPFCMTILALRMCSKANGVSELHGSVSREMWKHLYPDPGIGQGPIIHITNGIHTGGWASATAHEFWNKRLGFDWTARLMDPDYWKLLLDEKYATDGELWALRYTLRRELIEFTRRRLRDEYSRHGGGGIAQYDTFLSPDVMTICFARRFATYKRAPLLFRDLERTIGIISNVGKPVQVIFAGKAHPRDDEGKKFIKYIIEMTRHPQLYGKVVFIEDYDINVARRLVAGADVWLNTPRRPLEASGTSGMKIGIHGGLQVSTLDGWWREAYDGTNGWAIGEDASLTDPDRQDALDAASLAAVLEKEIIPMFYQRDADGIPHTWIRRIRHAMGTLIPQYSSDRMVVEYAQKFYCEMK
jgi:glycogen phosphorylase